MPIEGGLDTPSFKLLEQNEFVIQEKNELTKMTYFDELQKFLAQTQTAELITSHYAKDYLGLKVRVSFGQSNHARVPWIAFLNKPDTVQQGIYPVYLFYKSKKLLILAYGVSETRPADRNWELTNLKTIREFFKENNLGTAEKYGGSFVYNVYDLNNGLDQKIMDNDLNKLIDVYKKTKDRNQKLKPLEQFQYSKFVQDSHNSGLVFSPTSSLRFMVSLLAKPFVILTGLSGSGKTKLAQAFAMWICENKNQYCILSVGADWTNREPLLGFPNALKENGYVKPDNRVLDIIIEANKNSDKPYFLILDEMNLSHVERYFADFLSVMESESKISLHSGNQDWDDVPAEIGFPKNLFIIGTVNIDETTYMFSPKVLDRASVIEFRITAAEMESYLKNSKAVNLDNLMGLGSLMASSFVEIAKDHLVETNGSNELNDSLMNFFSELKKVGAEFGYRSAAEIRRFAVLVNKIDPLWTLSDIIDACIMQKLLPKVHGSRRKLEPVLKALGTFCMQGEYKFEEYFTTKQEIDFTNRGKIKHPLSLEKILRMYDNLISNGFTSYAEA